VSHFFDVVGTVNNSVDLNPAARVMIFTMDATSSLQGIDLSGLARF
jgi:hypothetical protein